jgi:hypothetical protein
MQPPSGTSHPGFPQPSNRHPELNATDLDVLQQTARRAVVRISASPPIEKLEMNAGVKAELPQVIASAPCPRNNSQWESVLTFTTFPAR